MKRPFGISAVCEQFGLPKEAQVKLEALVELLATDAAAPTSVTEPVEAVGVHIADSLSALPLIGSLQPDRPETGALVDIGSGAGFPGLPLAIALGRSPVDLVEATGRKCRFISRAIDQLELSDARAVCARAEDWARGEGAGRYRLAVVRAVAPLATLVEYGSPLLSKGGFLIAWKGLRDGEEERRGEAAARSVGMSIVEVRPVIPFPGSRRRHLHLFEKTEPTPPEIPRRAGMARKRPLGGK